MDVTIDLPPDVAERLARKAGGGGRDLAGYVRHLAVRDAGVSEALDEWDALLDSFSEGEAEDHRETVEALARGLNEDRPGQRRVFGEGYNPPAGGPS